MKFHPVSSIHFRFSLIISVAVLIAGCSGTKRITDRDAALPIGYPNHSYAEILQHMATHSFSVDAYHSESALAVKSPIQSGSFSASINHRKNDSLLISISPGFGIIAVRALVTPDSFYLHDRINRELSIGTIQDIQRLLPLPADSEALYSTMLGLWIPDLSPLWELTAEKGYYILKEPDNKRTLFIDPVYWRIVRYVENDADGQLIEERTFAEFEDFDGIYLPRRLTFRRPGDDTSASLYHRRLYLNPSALSFDFNVNKSVRRFYF